jgi:segregation and condensation protein B
MGPDELTAVVEAILLTARGPVTVDAVVEALADPEITPERVGEVLEGLSRRFERPDSGVRLERVAGGWRCVTPPQLDAHLRTFHGIAARHRLSQAALEVLAIVAHREPITMPEINFIRGTNSAGVVRTLLDRSLVRVSGRKRVVGKPFLYRTTKEFLVHFGLDRPEDLPDPEELVAGTESDEAESSDLAAER